MSAIYLAILPDYLAAGHPINEAMVAHINEKGCRDCERFREWHLNEKYARFRKPKVPSCKYMIDYVKKYLNAQTRAQHKRLAIS